MGQKNIALLGAMLARSATAPMDLQKFSAEDVRGRRGYQSKKKGVSHHAGHRPKKLRNIKGKSR